MNPGNESLKEPTEWLELMVPNHLKWTQPDLIDLVHGRLCAIWYGPRGKKEFSLPITPREAEWFESLPPRETGN